MNLEQLIGRLKKTPSFMENVTHWETIPAKEASFAPFPAELDNRLPPVLAQRGVYKLYSHQREAFDLAATGKDICVVTPTASGKTMCYNLPVLNAILKNNDARALYLFPTKALSADQVSELYELIEAMDVDVKTFTYDGDTPAAARRQVRQAGHIVVTNPDMLHSGILPHHTKWVKLFENLKYFLEAIMPVCDKYDINMAIHPDDPSWSVFGLPRIISSQAKLKRLIEMVPNKHNGVTFCMGSYGTNLNNDLVATVKMLKGRIHFAHIRNLRFNDGMRDFEESAHLSSDGTFDMHAVMKALYETGFEGPIRPDHGRMIWGEKAMPGYGLYDRALGAAYLCGLWEAIEKEAKSENK